MTRIKTEPKGLDQIQIKEGKLMGPIKDLLNPKACYIIIADEYRKIYLWKGSESNVRSKFIGAKQSQEIRGQVGLMYAVIPLNEGEEEPEFLKLIGEKDENGNVKLKKIEDTTDFILSDEDFPPV